MALVEPREAAWLMLDQRCRALALAVLQALDLVATQTSPKYGDNHLDHLRVPRRVRPVLPAVKVAAVISLLASASHPRWRSTTGAALTAYYSAPAGFHLLAGDRPMQLLGPFSGGHPTSATLFRPQWAAAVPRLS